MNSNIISFLVGALLSGLIFYFLPEGKYDQEFERVKLENDSLQLEMNYFIDSILVENEELQNFNDSIKLNVSSTNDNYERIKSRQNEKLNRVDNTHVDSVWNDFISDLNK